VDTPKQTPVFDGVPQVDGNGDPLAEADQVSEALTVSFSFDWR
jgi:hypothetical protein